MTTDWTELYEGRTLIGCNPVEVGKSAQAEITKLRHAIAAAPDMEAALQAYVDACDNDECEYCIKAKAALAKARGKDRR